jgi:lysozyme
MLPPSEACYNIIREYEDNAGFLLGRCTQLTAYVCPAGILTIGWGHTKSVVSGMIITAEQADELLAQDVAGVSKALGALLPPHVVLTQGQVDALVSLAYNMNGGPWALPRRCPRLWADLVSGEMPQAAGEFLDCDHAMIQGKPVELPGLKARREAEAKLFLGEAA